AFGGALRITTSDGSTSEYRIEDSRGGPVSPLSNAEIDEKFTGNAARLGAERFDSGLLGAIRGVRAGGGTRALMERL
ncbi:MAG: MmgE/PrpD family protein, partial [Actinobacteria bacterium]|nr:MmgE/PrpD family protein [Actinomycetota bacterium]NIU69894.1 MmgE/PrpD family protein [Actinomycetota bacterium]NIW31772.1 MmgE/PrpD family protein [Actinomycetota bacterium]